MVLEALIRTWLVDMVSLGIMACIFLLFQYSFLVRASCCCLYIAWEMKHYIIASILRVNLYIGCGVPCLTVIPRIPSYLLTQERIHVCIMIQETKGFFPSYRTEQPPRPPKSTTEQSHRRIYRGTITSDQPAKSHHSHR